MKVCMLTGLTKLDKIIKIKCTGGMGTQVPLLMQWLEKYGIEVTKDPSEEFDILHIHNPMPQYLPLIKDVKENGKPVVIHARHIPEVVKDGLILANTFYPVIEKYSKWVYNMGDVIICATPYVKRWVEKNGIKAKTVIIPNGVDCEKFKFDERKRKEFRKKNGYNEKDIIILSVGLLIPRKGVRDFIEVAKLLPELKFIWIGSTEPGLKKVDTTDAPENVKFIGYVPFEELPYAYSACDIFFFPTYAESFGNVLFEAASAGRPLVIRDIEVYKDWFEHEKNCLKGVNVKEFVRCIENLVENEKLRHDLGKEVKKLAKNFDIRYTVKKLINLYENLLNSKDSNFKERSSETFIF